MKKLILLSLLLFSFLMNAQTPIQEFNFDGTLNNTKNNLSFSGTAKYVNDRLGVPNSAQRLNNNTLEIAIGNLPVGNASRTVSIWVKYNNIVTANYIWGYGSSLNAQYFGLLQQSTTTSKSDLNLAGWGPANDLIVSTAIAPNTWYNYVVTYDGLSSKIYRNGELIKSSISPRKTTSGIVFGIGKMGSAVSIDADIDDLKIYDVALTNEEVYSIYNASPVLVPKDIAAVSSKTSVKKIKGTAVKPSSNVSGSTINTNGIYTGGVQAVSLKKAEIFSTQGQKMVTSTKQDINIGDLPEGTYLLTIVNSNKENNSDQAKGN